MLTVFAIALLTTAVLFLPTDAAEDADLEDYADSNDPPDPILVSTSDLLTGTDGDDFFRLEDPENTDLAANIDGGAGKDDIDLSIGTPFGVFIDSATIDGGAGDDLIAVDAREARIDGGDGRDQIWGRIEPDADADTPSHVNGGPDNDQIRIYVFDGSGGDTERTTAEIAGDDGNDVISGQYENAVVFGGAGNDYITSLRGTSGGNTLFGGDGDDTFKNPDTVNETLYGGDGDDVMQGSYDPLLTSFLIDQSGETAPPHVYDGGTGDDQIEFRLDRESLLRDLGLQDTNPQQVALLTGGEGNDSFRFSHFDGNVDIVSTPTTIELDMIEITDFTPGEDRIEFYSDLDAHGYTMGDVTATYDTDLDETRIAIPYVSDAPDQGNVTFVLTFAGQGVTAADVSLWNFWDA